MTTTPLWTPKNPQATQLARFMESCGHGANDYQAFWRWSIDNPVSFWDNVWDFSGILGDKGSPTLKDGDKMPGAQFYPHGGINYAENLLRRRDDHPAIIFSKEDGSERILTFGQLYDEVSRWEHALKRAGVGKGDRVAGFMPNIPETVIACLATVALGAVWSSASPDFGVQGVVDRFGQIEPKVLITVDGYLYGGKEIDCLGKLKEIIPRLPSVTNTILVPFLSDDSALEGTMKVDDFIRDMPTGHAHFARVPFNHPLFIMFSSGTTGIPKCIVHGHGGTLIQHLKEHRLHCDIRKKDKVFYFTTCGWMMWNWLISALASEATILLFDGNPFHRNGNVLWDFASRHDATLFGTSAKYIDAMKQAGMRVRGTHNLTMLRTITSTGSPLVHESFDYVYDAIKPDVHLASISGGTDIVSCFMLGNPISPVYRGEIQGPGLGLAVDIFDDDGKPLPAGAGSGELVCTKPFPSMPVSFWNDDGDAKYRAAYFERFDNVWCHGDWVERTVNEGFIIHGRSDATLNPGGVRIGTAEIYRQVEQIPEVIESIAVGQDFEGDVRILLFVRLRDGTELDDDLKARLKKQIKEGASPRHVPAKIIAIADIPRTKSGKITELAVRDVIHGRKIKNIEALANPQALDLYKDLLDLK